MAKTIIIIDDDDSILEVMTIILENNGFSVKALSNGKGVYKKIKDIKPNLIFLDVWMPGIDGKEITKILKRETDTKNIPIIIVSALNETENIAKEIGADSFLSKPFNMNELVAVASKFTKI